MAEEKRRTLLDEFEEDTYESKKEISEDKCSEKRETKAIIQDFERLEQRVADVMTLCSSMSMICKRAYYKYEQPFSTPCPQIANAKQAVISVIFCAV